jgi:DNA repair exonuclease SbcCD nuclease subunit
MKILFIGDLHLKISRIHEFKQVLAWIEDTIYNKKPDLVVNLGDTFDSHAVLRSEILTMFREHIRSIDVPYIYVLGNHDQYRPNDSKYHAMQNFDREDNFTVVDSIMDIHGMTFVPYLSDISKFPIHTKEICIAHQTFLGADYGFKRPDAGVNSDDVCASVVISGHVHRRQMFGKVIYPGTPIAHTAHDVDQEKGLMIFDTDTYDYRFIPSCLPLWKSLEVDLSDTTNPTKYIKDNIDAKNYWIIKVTGLRSDIDKLFSSAKYKRLQDEFNITTRINYIDNAKVKRRIEAVSIEKSVSEYISNIYSGTIDKDVLLKEANRVMGYDDETG